ncbi:MAG: acyl carrier protein [Nitrospirae bacterium]|nr:acyl carrier protein [Nitrospirota bacterium]MBF0541437.1 acyl carrier protein [Nitrospirota bacterium]
MDKKEIQKKVIDIITENRDMDKSLITPESSLRDDLGMDSFEAMEFIFYLEETYNIKIPDSDLVKLRVIKDIVDYLEIRFNEKN